MKRWIHASISNFSSKPRNERTRSMKSPERAELYDIQNDILEALDAETDGQNLCLNVLPRGKKGNRIDIFRDELEYDEDGNEAIRFTNKSYVDSIVSKIENIVDRLGYSDRVEVKVDAQPSWSGLMIYSIWIDISLKH